VNAVENPRTLLPCPFCGGEANPNGVARYSKDHEAWFADGTQVREAFFVNCLKCGVSNIGMIGYQTRDKAVAAWNKRFRSSGRTTPDLLTAAEALGAMPQGYCFCSRDRIGDDSKVHEPECAAMRAAIAKARGGQAVARCPLSGQPLSPRDRFDAESG